MPVPATTGQLRTRIDDMQIGDYIVASYTTGVVGNNITLFDTKGYAEYPVTGTAWSTAPNGYFYFVKVAKGLLVADRVIFHSVSWNTLNSYKLIQGRPDMLNQENIIPTMTSNTSPSGMASASSIAVATDAWMAFDGDINTFWQSLDNQSSNWIQYDFPNPVVIRSYSITSFNSSNRTFDPKSWTFEGWDGNQWVVIDSQTNKTFTVGQRLTFFTSNKTAYSKYRINISAINGGTHVIIANIEMMENAGVIRSLTGGVAYADSFGNKSLTDQGYGGWPVNNEWDRFIVGFPQELIQSGKTLDDVFHFTDARTWVQDTWYNLNTNRVQRGYTLVNNGAKYISYFASSSSSGAYGFRPVFEYVE